MASRSGSEKRQRTTIVTMRINPQEAAAIRQIARLRTALGSLTGAVNKVGSNFNQFAREANRGREPRVDSFVAEWEEFKSMFERDMAELRIVCLEALGKEPRRGKSADDEG